MIEERARVSYIWRRCSWIRRGLPKEGRLVVGRAIVGVVKPDGEEATARQLVKRLSTRNQAAREVGEMVQRWFCLRKNAEGRRLLLEQPLRLTLDVAILDLGLLPVEG